MSLLLSDQRELPGQVSAQPRLERVLGLVFALLPVQDWSNAIVRTSRP